MSDEGDSSPRILIVEDESLVALDEEALVRSLGFEVLGPEGHLEGALPYRGNRARPALSVPVTNKNGIRRVSSSAANG